MNEMHFIKLSDFIATGISPEKTDYLYENIVSGAPLRDENADYTNMYYVSKVINDYDIEITGYTTGVIKIVDLTALTGNWWYCHIPPLVKRILGRDIK